MIRIAEIKEWIWHQPIATHINLFRVLTPEQVTYNDKLINEFLKRGQLCTSY